MDENSPRIIQCTSCGAKNRISPEKSGGKAKCGKCGAALDTAKSPAGSEGAYLFRCPECGSKNKIPGHKVDTAARCGKCGTALSISGVFDGRPLEVSDGDFDAQVLHSPLPVLLEVWAPWCGPCQMVAPVMDELAAGWRGRGRVCKLNMDANPATAASAR